MPGCIMWTAISAVVIKNVQTKTAYKDKQNKIKYQNVFLSHYFGVINSKFPGIFPLTYIPIIYLCDTQYVYMLGMYF